VESDKVQARVKEWTITLDTYRVSSGSTTPLYRMRAPYVNKDGFRFTIYRKGIFSELGKRLGMQDIEVGDPDFDRDYVVQGNDEAKVLSLLANPKIRQLIQTQPSFNLKVKDDEAGSVRPSRRC